MVSQQSPTKATTKCYLQMGTDNERTCEISLSDISSIPELTELIIKEFQFASTSTFILSYLDLDEEIIEISSSISIWDIVNEAKSLIISKYVP